MKGVLVGLLLLPAIASSQCDPPWVRTWIEFSNGGSCLDTLWFGFHPSATYGVNAVFCEFELPPPPPAGVCDVRFVNIPGREGLDAPAGLGQGTLCDYRPFPPSGVDTFKIRFQVDDAGYPAMFRWSIIGILSIMDSAWLQDEFCGILVRARMNAVSQVSIANPALSTLLLITFGSPVDVPNPGDDLPGLYAMSQNYPNPFNPTTQIQFTIVTRQLTSVNVYDVLGRKVAVLVDEVKEPGTYTVRWDASDFPGGVYFYRLRAGQFTQARPMVLMK